MQTSNLVRDEIFPMEIGLFIYSLSELIFLTDFSSHIQKYMYFIIMVGKPEI